jgi:hypothetical protein
VITDILVCMEMCGRICNSHNVLHVCEVFKVAVLIGIRRGVLMELEAQE